MYTCQFALYFYPLSSINSSAINTYKKSDCVEAPTEFIQHKLSGAMTSGWDLANDVLGVEVDPQLLVQKGNQQSEFPVL